MADDAERASLPEFRSGPARQQWARDRGAAAAGASAWQNGEQAHADAGQ